LCAHDARRGGRVGGAARLRVSRGTPAYFAHLATTRFKPAVSQVSEHSSETAKGGSCPDAVAEAAEQLPSPEATEEVRSPVGCLCRATDRRSICRFTSSGACGQVPKSLASWGWTVGLGAIVLWAYTKTMSVLRLSSAARTQARAHAHADAHPRLQKTRPLS
jgi:hypothetical protein